MDITIEFSVFFYVFQHRSKLFFDIFSKMSFFDIRIVKNCMFLMFWRLGTMLERFFIWKSFRLHISKPKEYQKTHFLTWKSSKTYHFRSFQAKWTSPLNSAHFFTYFNTSQNWFSTFFRKWHFLDIRIVKNCMCLMFWRLGTMLERFFKAKSFGLHISKPK